MIIKRALNTIATVGVPLQSSNYSKSLMGDENITLAWEAPAFVAFQIGDYVVYEGANFTLNQLPTVKKISANKWQYNAVFQSTQYDLAKAMYLLFDNTPTPPQGEFTLTGTANTFMNLLLANMQRAMPSANWMLGEVIANTDYKTLTFTNESCHTVIARLAQEFDTEFHVNNRTLTLKRLSTEREFTLQYGTTLYDIERVSVDSSSIITRLYPTGAKTNLAFDYRGGNSPLRLPAANGNYIESNTNLYGIIESAKTFDDIYPRLSSGSAGVVTAVGNELTFTDSALDFNINDCLMDGTPAKVHFNTGQCAGYSFEIRYFNNSTKTFTLIPATLENDFTLPTAAIKPAQGDKYVLLDIVMPAAYLANAEAELLTRAQAFLAENAAPKVSYRATFSAIYAKLNVQNIECGDTVRVLDANMGIDEQIRITKVQRGLADYWNVQFDLSNTVTATRLDRMGSEIASVQNTVVVSNERINRNNLRAYQNTKELQGMIFDPDGYFDPENIKPLSIETSMLTVGAKSQSFQLSTLLQPNSAGNPQVLAWGAGLLTHFTIVDDAIKEWTISQGSITISGGNQSLALYIYARCNRTGTTGDIYLAPVALKFDEGSTYYYFLIGVLHTPIDNVRGISLTYGQSTINGGFIKTGVISSIDGATYFNLNTGEIGGNIKFRSGSTLKSVEQGFTDAATDATNKVNAVQIGAKNLILNSKVSFTTNQYAVTQLNLSENLIEGQEYVFTAISTSGTATLGLWRDEGHVYVGSMPVVNGRHILKFICPPKAAQSSLLNRISVWNLSTPNTIGVSNFMLQKGNKELDYSPAPDDNEAAINAINSNLSDISNDNKLTADEKQTVKKEWDAIAGEYSKLIAQADSLSVSRTVYAGVYSTLDTYLSPLIANLNTTSDIVGSTFRNNFTNYYNARTDLQNALTAKVQTNLSNTKPAGKNYLINSRTDNLTAWFLDGGTATVVADAKYKNVVEYSRPAGGGNFMKSFQIDRSELKNTELIYYCIAKPISASPVFAFGGWSETVGHLNQNSSFRDLGDGWRLYFRVFNAGGEIASSGTLGLNSVGGTWRFHSFGVCKGNQPPADWSAAPEEVDAKATAAKIAADAIANNLTTIDGGLILTTLIKMLSGGIESAGMAAKSPSNDVAFWGGGTLADAIEKLSKFGVMHSGDAWLKGRLEAGDGSKIGGLNITGQTLSSASMQFAEEPVDTISQLLSPQSVNISSQASWLSEVSGGIAKAYTQDINAPFQCMLNFRVTTSYADVDVEKQRYTVTVFNVAGQSVFSDSGKGSINKNYNISLPSGIYHIEATASYGPLDIGGGPYLQNVAQIRGISNATIISATGFVAKTMIGNNGLFSFWGAANYFYHSALQGLRVRGATDIPAGLGGATLTSAGNISAKWGRISNDNQIAKAGSEYTITHNLGDSNYSVILTPTSTSVPYIKPSTKGNNSVVLVCAGGFDFIIIRTQ